MSLVAITYGAVHSEPVSQFSINTIPSASKSHLSKKSRCAISEIQTKPLKQ
jgi:hypothetical protein